MTQPLYPLRFAPILRERVWGGRRLAAFGKDLPSSGSIGESWEVSDLASSVAEDAVSFIANGPWRGRTLHEVLLDQPEELLGRTARSQHGRFPLLIKFLDASENLSVQVHPSVEFARAHPEAHIKHEAWFIVHAEPGAAIYAGLKPGTTQSGFETALREGGIESLLRRIPVKVGQCHYLPSGTCHALGAGVVVAEVQTPSDTTFRLYDWNRTGRTLHVEQALACMTFPAEEIETMQPHPAITVHGFRTQMLSRCDYFSIERIDIEKDRPLDIITNGKAVVWMILSGRGRCEGGEWVDPVEVTVGNTILMPAGLKNWSARFDQPATVLRIETPDRNVGLTAGGDTNE